MPIIVAAPAIAVGLASLVKIVEELIKHIYGKSKEYSSLLKEIKAKIKAMEPVMERVGKMYEEMDRKEELDDFQKVIDDGVALVTKLKESSTWYKKIENTNKLKTLNKSLDTQRKLLKVRLEADILEASSNTNRNTADIFTVLKEDILDASSKTARNTTDILIVLKEMLMLLSSLSDNVVETMNNVQRSSPVQSQAKVGWLEVPEPPPFTVGLEMHLNELKKKLVEDGKPMALIVGHPGSGKTTLAKSFCHDKKVKDNFRSILVDVSQRSNIEIVQEIYENEGIQVPDFRSEEIALQKLRKLLNKAGQDPVLLVLDNVWSTNMTLLESLGCTEAEKSNYKILVISRHVLQEIDVVCHLEELNDDDALRLLHVSACLDHAKYPIPVDLQTEVVKFCKKLPLFIKVVGKSLSGKEIVTWKARVDAWSSGSSSITSEKQLRACLQSSLDALDEEYSEIKECFMDLASFPQGRRIPASVLIDMWTVLVDKGSANNDFQCFSKLHDLTYVSLATLIITRNQEGETDDYYGEHYLTQHDHLRDHAILLADEGPSEHRERLIIDIRGNIYPKWWEGQMDRPYNKARLVSISTDSQFDSKWRSIHLPRAKVLVLNFHTQNYGLPEFVEKMEELEVLLVSNDGFLPAEVSNFQSIGCLSKLKRIRLQRISISSITKNKIKLERLQKISFFMCSMGQAFSGGSIKFFEAFPNLHEISIDYCSDLVELPADICDQIQLKKLSVTNCHKLSALPKEIGKMENLELLRLRSCTDLSEFPDSIRKLESLKVLDISYCISIKELPEHIGEMCCLETLNMTQCSRLRELPESILDLEKLTDVICDHHTIGLWEPCMALLGNNIKIREVKEIYSLDWLHL